MPNPEFDNLVVHWHRWGVLWDTLIILCCTGTGEGCCEILWASCAALAQVRGAVITIWASCAALAHSQVRGAVIIIWASCAALAQVRGAVIIIWAACAGLAQVRGAVINVWNLFYFIMTSIILKHWQDFIASYHTDYSTVHVYKSKHHCLDWRHTIPTC